MNKLIQQLQGNNLVWQGHQRNLAIPSLSSGFTDLDQQLQGGFPNVGVVDIATDIGIGEFRLFTPYLRQSKSAEQLITFIAPPGQMNGEMLQTEELSSDKVLLLYPSSKKDALWAAEQCLKSGACHAVFLWIDAIEVHQAKRLQLAAEQGECLHVIVKPKKRHAVSLPVPLSMTLLPENRGIEVTIKKRRGGWPSAPFLVDMSHHWPQLTQTMPQSNVVSFPQSQAI